MNKPFLRTETNTTNYVPVGVSDKRLMGRWMVAGGNISCDPSDPSSKPQECVFQVEMGEANKGVGCSLGYASFLSGVNRLVNTIQCHQKSLGITRLKVDIWALIRLLLMLTMRRRFLVVVFCPVIFS